MRSASGSWPGVLRHPPAAGETDDVGVPGGDPQHPVAVAGDQDRDRRRCLLEVLRGVPEVIDPLAGTRYGISAASNSSRT